MTAVLLSLQGGPGAPGAPGQNGPPGPTGEQGPPVRTVECLCVVYSMYVGPNAQKVVTLYEYTVRLYPLYQTIMHASVSPLGFALVEYNLTILLSFLLSFYFVRIARSTFVKLLLI